jgi:hypothetical protein
MFSAAVNQTPSDPELHIALGVLHHLGRQFSAAIASFENALQVSGLKSDVSSLHVGGGFTSAMLSLEASFHWAWVEQRT